MMTRGTKITREGGLDKVRVLAELGGQGQGCALRWLLLAIQMMGTLRRNLNREGGRIVQYGGAEAVRLHRVIAYMFSMPWARAGSGMCLVCGCMEMDYVCIVRLTLATLKLESLTQ